MLMTNNKSFLLCSALIALSIVVLGFCIKGGIDNFANKDRKVAVKGLAEKEVDADKVTWPIVSKELGDDLPELYTRLGNTQSKIRRFLTANGIYVKEEGACRYHYCIFIEGLTKCVYLSEIYKRS